MLEAVPYLSLLYRDVSEITCVCGGLIDGCFASNITLARNIVAKCRANVI